MTDDDGDPIVPAAGGRHADAPPFAIASEQTGRIAVAVLVSCLAALVVLTPIAVRADGPTAFDLAISTWVAEHRTPLLVSTMRVVTMAGSFTAVVAVGAASLVVGLRRADLRPAAFIVATALLASWTTNLAKFLIARPRPAPDIAVRTFFGSSFPSGHATTAAALWGAVAVVVVASGICSLRTAVASWAAIVLVVCGSRVVLGAHWLSDVTAGASVGTAWVAGAVLIAGPALLGGIARPRSSR